MRCEATAYNACSCAHIVSATPLGLRPLGRPVLPSFFIILPVLHVLPPVIVPTPNPFHSSNMRFYTFISILLVAEVEAVFWLNQFDSYDSLPYCAEGPISSIVRDMVSGCGDGGRTTSYSCFCTRSSSSFMQIIATAVAKECSYWGTEVSSATSIFHEYCQLGGGARQTIATTKLTTG